MRALILIAGALALAACGKKDQAGSIANADESLTAENIVSNDVTAIDAVTGDAANMAAESDINDIGAPTPNTGSMAATAKPTAAAKAASTKPAAAKPQPKTPAPAATTSPASNAAGNTAG